MREREREKGVPQNWKLPVVTERQTETDRQTDRPTNRQTDRQTDRERERSGCHKIGSYQS